MTLEPPQQQRACVTCQSETTYEYKGQPRWHRTPDGSYQCHACYSTKSKKVQPDELGRRIAETKSAVAKAVTAEDPQAIETKKRMEQARQEVNDATDAEAMRKACKRFTNYIEPIMRKEKEAKQVA